MNEEEKRWELANAVTGLSVALGLVFLLVFNDKTGLGADVLAYPELRWLSLVILVILVTACMIIVRNLGRRYLAARRARLWRQATTGRIVVIVLFNLPLLHVLLPL